MLIGGRNATQPSSGDAQDDVYEALYGLNRQSGFAIGICLLFCLIVSFTHASIVLQILTFGFFGLGGLLLAVVAAVGLTTRKAALRVDAAGVTMNRKPLSARPGRLYPWEDIDALVIWEANRLAHLGIIRRDGSAPLTERQSGRLARGASKYLAPYLPHETVATSIPANAWVLRADRVARAAARFAPRVRVFDLRPKARERLDAAPPPTGPA